MRLLHVDLCNMRLLKILATHRHVDRIANAEKSIVKLCVHVFRAMSEVHRRVTPNVLLILIVRRTKPVLIKSVEIPALELVALVPVALSSTTIQSVVVLSVTQATHSSVASL